ncbi:hypothetical protein FB451DRAFT_1191605 [Mycena latifolia]|nr:hypothetical protein FB451DRAFT_1191605 [Mycena latifolia]
MLQNLLLVFASSRIARSRKPLACLLGIVSLLRSGHLKISSSTSKDGFLGHITQCRQWEQKQGGARGLRGRLDQENQRKNNRREPWWDYAKFRTADLDLSPAAREFRNISAVCLVPTGESQNLRLSPGVYMSCDFSVKGGLDAEYPRAEREMRIYSAPALISPQVSRTDAAARKALGARARCITGDACLNRLRNFNIAKQHVGGSSAAVDHQIPNIERWLSGPTEPAMGRIFISNGQGETESSCEEFTISLGGWAPVNKGAVAESGRSESGVYA